jgi:hypothetical protein
MDIPEGLNCQGKKSNMGECKPGEGRMRSELLHNRGLGHGGTFSGTLLSTDGIIHQPGEGLGDGLL